MDILYLLNFLQRNTDILFTNSNSTKQPLLHLNIKVMWHWCRSPCWIKCINAWCEVGQQLTDVWLFHPLIFHKEAGDTRGLTPAPDKWHSRIPSPFTTFSPLPLSPSLISSAAICCGSLSAALAPLYVLRAWAVASLCVKEARLHLNTLIWGGGGGGGVKKERKRGRGGEGARGECVWRILANINSLCKSAAQTNWQARITPARSWIKSMKALAPLTLDLRPRPAHRSVLVMHTNNSAGVDPIVSRPTLCFRTVVTSDEPLSPALTEGCKLSPKGNSRLKSGLTEINPCSRCVCAFEWNSFIPALHDPNDFCFYFSFLTKSYQAPKTHSWCFSWRGREIAKDFFFFFQSL